MPKLKKSTRDSQSRKKFALMVINDLELRVHLGWSEQERKKKRPVLLSVTVQFPTPPKACVSDKLDDTLCYQKLSLLLQQRVEKKSFRLVENLACAIYDEVKGAAPKNSIVAVHVTKFPHIKALTGGVCFHYGDDI